MSYSAIANEIKSYSRKDKINEIIKNIPNKAIKHEEQLIKSKIKKINKEIEEIANSLEENNLTQNEEIDFILSTNIENLNKQNKKLELLKNNKNLYFTEKLKKSLNKINSILYYSSNRDEIFKEILNELHITTKSMKSDIKQKLKIEFLSVLFGKKNPSKLINDNRDETIFTEHFSYIKQDKEDFLNEFYHIIKYYYKEKYGFISNKRNFFSKLFMAIESDIMNRISNEFKSVKKFRLHDAIYIKLNGNSNSNLSRINSILKDFNLKAKIA